MGEPDVLITDPCLCLEPCGLLLQFAHRVTSFSHRQASACPQCSSPTAASMTAGYRGHCIMTFTGWMLLNGFSSEWLQLYTSVCTAWLQRTCLPITASASHRGGLRSATTSNLVIPRCRRSTYGTRALSVAGTVCWNPLPDYLKSSDLSFSCFRRQLKTFLFCKY